MKKLFSILMIFILAALLTTPASALQGEELGQLKVCKAGGSSVTQGQLFTIRVGNTDYQVPAGYCVLAGQFALNTQVTIQEMTPAGYYVAGINVRPASRTVSQDLAAGRVVISIGSGVTEVIYTNLRVGTPTSTPRPTNTPSTGTPQPTGRLQICKEAGDPGVIGYFNFRFNARLFRVPVGACSVLVHADVGTLTITEDAQSGYTLADVYTIPASRLISKDLNGGSATVQIVEGTAASQTIVVFRNRSITTPTPTGTATSTPTSTPTGTVTPPTATATPTGTLTVTATSTPTGSATPTNTPTATPTLVCPPARITANFNNVAVGESVEGMGKVAPNLNIDATSPGNPNALAVRVAQNQGAEVYLAPNDEIITTTVLNGGLVADGGFSDVSTRNLGGAHEYTFSFAPGVTVSNFTLHMLDYGDFNPTLATSHLVTMIGYDANGNEIPTTRQVLSYTTPAEKNPRSSSNPDYGDLWFSGDAVWARWDIDIKKAQPGNWMWNISGSKIAKVVLAFPEGYDPRVAFDLLSFTVTELCVCQAPATTADYFADFSKVAVGGSVEGMGKVAPNLNIDATSPRNPGDPESIAVKVAQAQGAAVYFAPNDSGGRNGGLVADGGFSDVNTRNRGGAHEYTFSFASGVTVSNFSLHMLDYGDLNQLITPTNHLVVMTAYDVNGQEIPSARQQLSYTAPPDKNPRSSNLFGDLWFSGDAVSAKFEQPGNWTWNISGTGIAKIILSFPQGHDPNVAFNRLNYSVECPLP